MNSKSSGGTMRRSRTLALIAVGAGALTLSACGNGADVIVSDAGVPSGGEPTAQAEPTIPTDGEQPAEPADSQPADGQPADEDSGDNTAPSDPDGKPGEVVAEIREELDDAPISGDEALDALDEPLDEEPTRAEIREARNDRADTGVSAEGPRNEAGEPLELDEAASLACADVERALTAFDEGSADSAVADADSAAGRAGDSAVADIAEWSEALGAWTGADNDPAVLLGFLSTCTDGGYEL